MFDLSKIIIFILVSFIFYFINCRFLHSGHSIIETNKNLNNPIIVDYASNKNLYQSYNYISDAITLSYFYNIFQNLYLGFGLDINSKTKYDYFSAYNTLKTYEENKITYKINKIGSLNIRYTVYNTEQLKIYLGTFVSLFQQKLDVFNFFSEVKPISTNIVEDTKYNSDNEIPTEFVQGNFSACTAGYYASPDLNIAWNPITNEAFITSGYIICSTNHTIYTDKTFNYRDYKNITELQYYIGFDVTTSYTLYKNIAVGLSCGVTNISKFTIPAMKYSDIKATFYTNSLYTKLFLSFNF